MEGTFAVTDPAWAMPVNIWPNGAEASYKDLENVMARIKDHLFNLGPEAAAAWTVRTTPGRSRSGCTQTCGHSQGCGPAQPLQDDKTHHCTWPGWQK